MTSMVLFQMWSGHREQLIEKHRFYVQQAVTRILEPMTDKAFEDDADRVTEESWEARGHNFDPDFHDPADQAEAAYEDGNWRYQLLTELRNDMRLSIIAGFFHAWEKSLRQWLVDEAGKWHFGQELRKLLWLKNISKILELIESFGFDLKAKAYFPALDACRLIVNVYKHGDGASLDTLVKTYPQYIDHSHMPAPGSLAAQFITPGHQDLNINDEDLQKFADAITNFWLDIPENTLDSQIANPPGWALEAINKDRSKN